MNLPLLVLVFVISARTAVATAIENPLCGTAASLFEALECVRANEPAYRDATNAVAEASDLENTAYRLINPEFNYEYLRGSSLGATQQETNASLLFTFELGGKRAARATRLNAEGLNLKADAFDQKITALTELGGALLRLNQLEREKEVLQESADTFGKIVRLYRTRGKLPPEQRVSLNAFELITLDYHRKILETDTELLRFHLRTQRLFGHQTKGQPLEVSRFVVDLKTAAKSLDEWIEHTPEMLRLRAEQRKVEGDFAVARAETWPDLKIGPSFRQVSAGPIAYSALGMTIAFPIPVFTWNTSLRSSRGMTEKRVFSKTHWEAQDIRVKYLATLSQLEKIAKLLQETPSEADIQRKHRTTESFFSRGLVSGALIIEAHRSLVEYYETKHDMERQFLHDVLKIQSLSIPRGDS